MNTATRRTAAWWNFQMRVEELGGVVLEHEWLGDGVAHRVRCANGHTSSPYPGNVAKGRGICRVCAGKDPETSRLNFQKRVAELGGVVLEESWLGSNFRHRVRCASGHVNLVKPGNLSSGQGICRTCGYAGNVRLTSQREASWLRFQSRVLELGGEVLEPGYLGKDEPHRVRCENGHVVTPTPGNVAGGQGLCRACKGAAWDAFYVVHNPDTSVIKFGITSGDPRPRLREHRSRDRFTSALRTFTDLPEGEVVLLEKELMLLMKCAGVAPIRGREYFPDAAMNVILGHVDAWFE